MSNIFHYHVLENLLYMGKYKKKSYKNIRCKISAPKRNDDVDLSDVSYTVLHIQDYFEFIVRKHGALTDNCSI